MREFWSAKLARGSLLLGCRVLLGMCFAQAASGWQTSIGPSSSDEGVDNPKQVEAFLDQFFKTKMEEFHCPGATVVVVKDGKQLLAKGYGYADVSQQIPVDPEKTRFYIASVSKLFTATAVMQLYDRRMLRLDEDVNRYLKHTQAECQQKHREPPSIIETGQFTPTVGFSCVRAVSTTRGSRFLSASATLIGRFNSIPSPSQ